MNAAQPAAGAAHSFLELPGCPFYMVLSGFLLFDEGNPAEPLIAGQGGEIFPHLKRLGVRKQSLPQIGRKVVGDTARNNLFIHGVILMDSLAIQQRVPGYIKTLDKSQKRAPASPQSGMLSKLV